MEQTDISAPEVTSGVGYSLVYSLYSHCAAYVLRKAVAQYTGTGALFTKHGFVETPGLGEGRVKFSVCVPDHDGQADEAVPLVLVIEGGGFVLGQPSDGEANDLLLSQNLNAVVLSVDYAKSPRYPFPHALLQLYQVLQWCFSSNATDELGRKIDPTRVAIMGNSAGGNLTASLSLLTAFTTGPCAKFREGLPGNYRQVAQVLLYPSVALDQLYRSRFADKSAEVQAESLPIWVAELMEGSYLPPFVNKEQIFVAPSLIDSHLLKKIRHNVAPVSCHVAGLDCLEDEAVDFCRKLEEAGVEVHLERYPNANHGFSHYKADNKKFRKGDVEDCWNSISTFLSNAFKHCSDGK